MLVEIFEKYHVFGWNYVTSGVNWGVGACILRPISVVFGANSREIRRFWLVFITRSNVIPGYFVRYGVLSRGELRASITTFAVSAVQRWTKMARHKLMAG